MFECYHLWATNKTTPEFENFRKIVPIHNSHKFI